MILGLGRGLGDDDLTIGGSNDTTARQLLAEDAARRDAAAMAAPTQPLLGIGKTGWTVINLGLGTAAMVHGVKKKSTLWKALGVGWFLNAVVIETINPMRLP